MLTLEFDLTKINDSAVDQVLVPHSVCSFFVHYVNLFDEMKFCSRLWP